MSLVTSFHQVGENVQVSFDKEALKLISKVSNHPLLSNEANWEMVTIVYKHESSGKRLVSGIKNDFSKTDDVRVKSDMSGGEVYELYKILISGQDRTPILSIKRDEIANASSMDLTLSGETNPPSSYESLVLSHNPRFYYRFNETSGTYLADFGGHVNRTAHVAVPGNITFNNPGPIPGGKSLYFDQTRIVTDFGANNTTEMSVEWWFKGSEGGNMIAHWSGTGITNWNILPYFSLRFAGGNVQAYYLNGFNYNNSSGPEPVNSPYEPTALTNNTWHHVVYTQSATKRVLYLDGVAVDTKTSNFAPVDLWEPWHIGGWGSNLSEAYKGYMAEVALYNSELSAADVLAHYQAAF